ncbi:MAG: hypothetical protein JO081_20310 [Alphaproteobacteria bacterium]|nr:hypothetical protein [Alphaproteobacteria bacterium]
MQTASAVEQLYEKFRHDPAAKQVLSWLARYQNRVTETVVDRVAGALPNVSSGTVLGLFREMHRLKFGELKLGRHGQKTRILWTAHPGDIGKQFLELISAEMRAWPNEVDIEPETVQDLEAATENLSLTPQLHGNSTRLAEGERELTRGLLSPDASFRLIVRGKIGPKEIERLIKKLEFDKQILAGDHS